VSEHVEYRISNVPPDLDPENPGHLVCAFSGGALIKFDSQGRMRVEVAVDPHHDWTAMLVKDLRLTRLTFHVYVPTEDAASEVGPEHIHNKVAELDASMQERQWERAKARMFEGTEEAGDE
jgi:hypothetical protein